MPTTTSASYHDKTKTKTAVIDGQELTAQEVAQVHEVREIFDKLKRSLKQIALYRHNTDRYGEYLKDVYSRLHDYLRRNGSLDLRVGPINFRFRGVEVFRDESREGNLCYPFYQHGVRLLMFKEGLTADDLVKLVTILLDHNPRDLSAEDFITKLWKAELQGIEWIVVESFKVLDEDDDEEVKVEVDQIVKYLYRQLQANTEDIQRFARVSLEDLDMKLDNVDSMREGVIEGVTATQADKERIQRSLAEEEAERLVPKMVMILFQLLELDTTDENFEDVAEGFVQLLDSMLLSGDFKGIQEIRDRFARRLQKPNLKPQVRDLVQRAAQRFVDRMGEPQRLSAIAQRLNAGKVEDPEGLKAYLTSLPSETVPAIADMLETIEIPQNRRLVCDVLVEIGKEHESVFASRLEHPSSNVVKDMLYIIDRIDSPRKYQLFARVLNHPNAVLKLEALNTIGRNPTEECYRIVLNAFKGDDPQLRTAAARLLPNYDANRVAPVLLEALGDGFDGRSRHEQMAILQALVQTNHPDADAYLQGLFAEKGGLLQRKKVDERKLMVIEALSQVPSLRAFQFLAQQAQNLETNSKEVAEAARQAALKMRDRLSGGR